jgi:transglutaminase-like putative cysteine protease
MSRLKIREGWSTVLLTAAVVWIAVWSIQQADWADNLGVLNYVMLAGLVAGFVVSKWRQVPSAVLHLAGLTFGVLVVIIAVTSFLNDSLGTRRDKLVWLWDRAGVWFNQVITGGAADDLYIFVVFISSLTFLLAYSTMWFVLRARWIWAALVFPGVLLMINLGYSNQVQTSLVVLFLFASIVLLARFYLMQRETTWRRGRVEYPNSLPWRGMWVGSYLAIGVLIFGWAVPVSAQSDSINDFWRDVDGPWRTVESQFGDWFAGLRGPGAGGVGGFASFADNFDMGGPLQLSDAPVVLLDGPGGAPYLTAHRYNEYTGRGWQSNIHQTHPDNDGSFSYVAPQVELRPDESVPLPSQFAAERNRATYTLEVQRTRGNLMFAPEVFSSSDLGTNLLLSWNTVDQTVNVQDVDTAALPSELATLVEMLKDLDLSPPLPPEPTPNPDAAPTPEGAEPEPTSTPDQTRQMLPVPPEVRAEQARLAERDILVSFVMDQSTFRVSTMTFSGTFPMYSDVEAVYARDGLETGASYSVTSLNTRVTNDQLRQAGNQYPDHVVARYIQLPDTVTERTRNLAFDLTASATSDYDAAKMIESFLRSEIAYTENIPFPPPDVDVVDHVLFEDPRGYCEYYASAFIVMARSIGLPARMAVGFYPSDERDGSEYLYRELNAHAWPEVYFEGYGWIGFEPTAGRAEVSRSPVTGGGGSPTDRDEELFPGAGEGRLDDGFFDDMLMEENMLPDGVGGTRGPIDEISAGQILSRLIIGGFMFVLLAVMFLWMRGMRGLSPTHQFFAKFTRGAGWGGVKRQPWMTPHEYARSVGDVVPGSRAPATYLTDLYVQETYGNRPPAQAELMRARQAWLRLRGVLFKHLVMRLRPWGGKQSSTQDMDDWT